MHAERLPQRRSAVMANAGSGRTARAPKANLPLLIAALCVAALLTRHVAAEEHGHASAGGYGDSRFPLDRREHGPSRPSFTRSRPALRRGDATAGTGGAAADLGAQRHLLLLRGEAGPVDTRVAPEFHEDPAPAALRRLASESAGGQYLVHVHPDRRPGTVLRAVEAATGLRHCGFVPNRCVGGANGVPTVPVLLPFPGV